MSFKSLLTALMLAVLCSGSPALAQVQDDTARVVVPDVRGGALVAGCYTADRNLYGPYRLSFCLQRRASYSVRGNGLNCDSDLAWQTRGRNVNINLNRSNCNRGVSWAAANIVCRPRSAGDLLMDKLLSQKNGNGDQRVVVPTNSRVAKLSCTYRPSVPGKRATNFFAVRRN